MKRAIYIAVAAATLLLASSLPALAHGYVRGGIWIGPGWGPGWWGPAYPYPYPYYASPPVVVQQQPEVYVEPQQQQEAPSYWYYCQKPQGYYPYVKQCPGGWMKVVPSPQAPEEEEE